MKIYWHKGSKNIIGNRVKEARLNCNPVLTQGHLSAKLELLGVKLDRISVSRLESGDRFVADYEVIAIAEALDVDLNWLLLGKT